MKHLELIIGVTLFLIVLSAGILIGKIFYFPGITCELKLNPLHALSILTSLFLALVVSCFWAKLKENHKLCKDIFFHRLREILDRIEILKKNLKKQMNINEIIGPISDLQKIFARFENSMTISKTTVDYKPEAFKEKTKSLRVLMTDTPIVAENNDELPIVIEANIAQYSTTRYDEIEKKLREIEDYILELEFKIANS